MAFASKRATTILIAAAIAVFAAEAILSAIEGVIWGTHPYPAWTARAWSAAWLAALLLAGLAGLSLWLRRRRES